MTVLYTETHLTADPVYRSDKVAFNIALSSITVQCQAHREEIIAYIREKKLRKGDMVQILGVFFTETEPTEVNYIHINKIGLIDEFEISTGKKRKYEHLLQGDPISWIQEDSPSELSGTTEYEGKRVLDSRYVNVSGEFSDYFFLMYGKVQYVFYCINHHRQTTEGVEMNSELARTKQQLDQLQQDTMSRTDATFHQIYDTFVDIQKNGANRSNVTQFVDSVKELTTMLFGLINSSNHELPAGLSLDQKIYLPAFIYQFYAAL